MEAINSTESPPRYIVVLKIGGNELDDEAFIFGLVKAVKAVQEEGHFPVIVHGGGKAVTDYGKKLGLEEKRIDGLRITDNATLDLSLMAWRSWPSWDQRKVVVFTKVHDLGVKFRVVPICMLDGAGPIVKDDYLRNTSKSPKCILKNLNEAFDGHLGDRFRVPFPRMAQYGSKDVCLDELPFVVLASRSGSKINLHFGAWFAFDSAKGWIGRFAKPGNVSPHGRILSSESMIGLKVLMDALCGQTSL